MRRVGILVLQVINLVLQTLVPPKPDQVVWTSSPDYAGNAFHLYRHMLATRTGHHHVWLLLDDEADPRVQADIDHWGLAANGNTAQVILRHSLRGYWAYLRSRYAFHTHGVYRWVGTAIRRQCVSMWHGMPIKAIGALNTRSPNPNPTYGELHLATSGTYRQIIAAAFRVPQEKVLLSSLPRCDVLTAPSPLAPPPGDVRAALGIRDNDRLVLWMPTYRTPRNMRDLGTGIVGFRTFLDDLDPAAWERIDRNADAAGARVVVKLHPEDALNTTDFDPREAWELERVHLVRAEEWLATGIELYDLLAITDGLITDISSVLIDWLLTDRPLGQVGFDPATYTRDVVIDVDRLMSSPRVHDLGDASLVEDFFDRVRHGTPTVDDPDLSDWLYRRDLGSGCEAVLRAVGL